VSRPTSRRRRRIAARSICRSPTHLRIRPSPAMPPRPRQGGSRCPKRPAPAYCGSASSRRAATGRRSPRGRPARRTASADRWRNGRCRSLALFSPTPSSRCMTYAFLPPGYCGPIAAFCKIQSMARAHQPPATVRFRQSGHFSRHYPRPNHSGPSGSLPGHP
jgi:hypothetical protein